VLTKHPSPLVLVLVEMLLSVIKDIFVFWGRWRRTLLRQTSANLGVYLRNSFALDVEGESRTVPELITHGDLKRHENLVDCLLLGGIETRIVFRADQLNLFMYGPVRPRRPGR
jgi:hypothetical protein